MNQINDINDFRLVEYKNLKKKNASNLENNLFVADSLKVVNELLLSDLKIISLLLTPENYNQIEEKLVAKKINKDNIFIAYKKIMKEIVGYNVHDGAMALAEIPSPTNIKSMNDNIVVLNDIVDAENVGAIIRNMIAFNINSLIIDAGTVHPYMRRAVRVSMGSVFSCEYYVSMNIKNEIFYLKNKGYNVCSIENNEKSIPYNTIDFSGKNVLIFGNESNGIGSDILEASEKILHIPINNLNSINVAASTAIIFNYLNH